MSVKRLLEIKKLCHDNRVSVNDYLLAALFQVSSTNKIVIGVDSRCPPRYNLLSSWCYWQLFFGCWDYIQK